MLIKALLQTWTWAHHRVMEEDTYILSSNATVEAHSLLRTFDSIEWECELYSGRPKAQWYDMNNDITVMIS
jgi:hypothetical protein